MRIARQSWLSNIDIETTFSIYLCMVIPVFYDLLGRTEDCEVYQDLLYQILAKWNLELGSLKQKN